MDNTTPHPMTIVQSASHAAIKVGFLCSVSFLCTIRGITSPGIATIGHFAGLLAIYNIFKNILRYKLFEQDIRFGRCFRMAMLICIFAGLLTNVVQYLYFQFFDKGYFLSTMATMMEMPEYQQMIKSVFAGVPQSQLDEAFLQINVPTLMVQFVFMNLVLSVPVSLVTAALAAMTKISRKTINQSENNTEKE